MNTALHSISLNSWIRTVDTYLSSQHEEMMNLKTKLKEISDLGYNLTGQGGTAIKLFYHEAHIPLIQFYQVLVAEVRDFFQKYEAAFRNLDSAETTYIESNFLENELRNTLKQFRNKVTSMTDQTNDVMNQVSDIVSLPKINDNEVLSGIEQSITKAQNTSVQLQQLDYRHLQVVQILNQDVIHLRTYISKLSSLVSSENFNVSDFKSGDLNKYSWYHNLKTAMAAKENIPGELRKELLKEKLNEKLDVITNFFSKINQALTFSDNVMTTLKAGFAAAFGATGFLTDNPLLKVNIKPGNKFTLTAGNSWKASSRYSNPIANAIHKIQKAPAPTNFFGRQLSNFLKSYDNPSSVMKHFLGFKKNVTSAVRADTLSQYTTARAKYGTKELLSDLTAKAGFSKVSKAIPFVGSGVVIASNFSEITKPENADKTMTDRVARFSAGTVMDLGAAAAGAKIGGTLGAALGPVGIVAGGAVGAVAGTILSSKLKEPVTDIVGKTVNKIEEGVGKAFKSIGSWFK